MRRSRNKAGAKVKYRELKQHNKLIGKTMGQTRRKLVFLILAAKLIGFSVTAAACGGFSSQVEVIRPSTAEALFALPSVTRKMTVGDRFAVILPAPRKNMHWRVSLAEPGFLEAFTPTDETGSNVFAWRLIKPGSTGVMVSEDSDTLPESRIVLFFLDISPAWTPPVVNLDETNDGQTISFSQRDVLKINLAHPGNAAGYWQIDMGLDELDIEYGGPEAVRGHQVLAEEHWRTEITIDTTHMPGQELRLSFHAQHPSFATIFSKSIFYRLKGQPAPLC